MRFQSGKNVGEITHEHSYENALKILTNRIQHNRKRIIHHVPKNVRPVQDSQRNQHRSASQQSKEGKPPIL